MTYKNKLPLKLQGMDLREYTQAEGKKKCREHGAKAKRNEVWQGEVEKKR